MSAPTVSVIMAAYNGATLIEETIDSLIAQSFTDWELIVVDDCSPDDTVAVVRAYDDPRIRLIESERNGGPVVARNRAFAATAGRYIAALDQDDLCLPERLAKQVAFLDANPDVVLVSTAAQFLMDGKVSAGNWPRPLSPGLIDWLMRLQNPIVWSSVMFRSDAARRLVPFERPEMRYVEDFDFYHRIRKHGLLAQIDEELLLYRCHAGGASQMFNGMMRDHAEALISGHAPDIAPLLVRHVMARDPVPDGATLERHWTGSAWSDWSSLGGTSTSGPAAAPGVTQRQHADHVRRGPGTSRRPGLQHVPRAGPPTYRRRGRRAARAAAARSRRDPPTGGRGRAPRRDARVATGTLLRSAPAAAGPAARRREPGGTPDRRRLRLL